MTTDQRRRLEFFFGAVLIGLAAAELAYSAFRRMRPSLGAPIWARVLYIALPGYLAIVEPHALRRVGWAILGICAAASWLLDEHIVAASMVVSISLLQMFAGALSVRTSVSVIPVRQRLLGLVADGTAAAVRIGTLYWWAQTLERYAVAA